MQIVKETLSETGSITSRVDSPLLVGYHSRYEMDIDEAKALRRYLESMIN